MQQPYLESLFLPALKRIKRIDCSTSGCRANGRCTGYLRRHERRGWVIEVRCPDCDSTGTISTRAVQGFGERVSAAAADERDALVKSFIQTRARNTRPFSAPWP